MWYGSHDHVMVTSSSAPRIDILTEYAPLFTNYFKVVPNSKLPPKFHSESLLAVHREVWPIFCGSESATVQADVWAGHIRNAAVKYRDLVRSQAKLAVVERGACIISWAAFQG